MKEYSLSNGTNLLLAETDDEKKSQFFYQPDEEYFGLKYINNGLLGLLNQGVDCFLKEPEPKKQQPYFSLGSLVHSLLLEPDLVNDRFEVLDSSIEIPKPDSVVGRAISIIESDMNYLQAVIDDYMGLSDREWVWQLLVDMLKTRYTLGTLREKVLEYYPYIGSSLGKFKIQLTSEQWEIGQILNEKANQLDEWLAVKDNLKTEYTITGCLPESQGFICKGKIDFLPLVGLGDCKTTSQSIRGFRGDYIGKQYYRQLAFYLDLYNEYARQNGLELRSDSSCSILALQTVKPHSVWWIDIREGDIREGRKEYQRLLLDLTTRILTNNWKVGTVVYDNFNYSKSNSREDLFSFLIPDNEEDISKFLEE